MFLHEAVAGRMVVGRDRKALVALSVGAVFLEVVCRSSI